MEAVIAVKNISKRFGRLEALKNISLDLNHGECIALIGPNGCGKTTLIKSILGMVIPTGGEIFFKGNSIHRDFHYRNRIGYMPQIGRYPENMSILQVMNIIKSIRPLVREYDEELIHRFRLQKMYDQRMRTLSGGTTQKVSASLAFLFNPDVLILDEPTAGLDPLAAELLKEKIIREKQKGKLILITSHLLNELDDLVSQVIFMQEGRLIFHKEINLLQSETGETRVSKAIARVLKSRIT